MDEILVDKILKKDEKTRAIYLGSFARDELPAKPAYPSCFILNTEPRSEPGQHWLAIFYNKRGFAEFFDSFGHDPEYFDLEDYLNKTAKGWSSNKKIIQGSSDLCGIYCILFLIYAVREKTIVFFSQFKNNVKKNDSILYDYLNN